MRWCPEFDSAGREIPPTRRRNALAEREPQRIAKLLARAGIASRREIERMIAEGRIAINGVAVDKPATLLTSLHGVTVDGNAVKAAAPARLFRYHKPAGLLTAERDPAGRRTIYDALPKDLPRVMPVGRLDLNTEGLLLLTTDGGLKRELELPATGVERTYRARAFGEISQARLEDLFDGIEIEGIRYGPIDANLERRTGRNQWIEMKLREGKNREVRRVLEHLGLQVSRLIRTAYGPFELADLPPGAVDEIRQHDLVAFRKSLGSDASAPAERAARRPASVTPSARGDARGQRTGAAGTRPARPSRPAQRGDEPRARTARPFYAKDGTRPARAGRPPRREDDPRGATAARPSYAKDGVRPVRAGRPQQREDDPRATKAARPSYAKDGPRPARTGRPPKREDDPRGARAGRPSYAKDGPRAGAGRPPKREDEPRGARAGRPSHSEGGPRTAGAGRPTKREDQPRGARASRPSHPKGADRSGEANPAPQPGGRSSDKPRRGPPPPRRSAPRSPFRGGSK